MTILGCNYRNLESSLILYLSDRELCDVDGGWCVINGIMCGVNTGSQCIVNGIMCAVNYGIIVQEKSKEIKI